jgi:ectoine hydroxylase-related dioxygenase (phytanoyl-CoA dioxygenase family)
MNPVKTPTLHPKSDGFKWQGLSAPFRRLTPEQAEQFDEQGWFVLEDAFTADEMDAVAAAIDPFEQTVEAYLRGLEGGRMFIAKADAITFTTHLVAKSAALRAFARHAVFQDLCADIIGPHARLYWDQAVYKKPGNPEEFPWHQDNGYTFIEPQQYLTCWLALNDATTENGCPCVAPRIHRRGTLQHWPTPNGFACLENPQHVIEAPVRKGSIVVFSSLTPHRTGPNLTTGVRKAYILQYAPDGARAFRNPAGAGELQNDPARQFLIDA